MKEVFKDYLNDKIKLERYQLVGIICLIIVFSGIFGWVYEFIFYYFNGGMKEFYLQGGNFLPWINIYAIGAILILISTKKLKKHPILIFLIAMLVTGILEYFSGLAIYKLNNGARYWDYNTEILNFGNIDGFVCLRSVLVFGFSALILMYIMVPFCIYLSKKMSKKTFLIICISLLSIVLLDEFYNLLIARIFDIPRATRIYKYLGFKYV
jgi:uncharacterized membrane protein